MGNNRWSNNYIGKEEDPNKWCTRQFLSLLRLMPDPIPKSRMDTLWVTPSIYMVDMMSHGVEYPFNQFRLPVPAMLLPGFVWDREKRSPWFRINMTQQNPKYQCYQHQSHSESKTQHWNSYWGETNAILTETRTPVHVLSRTEMWSDFPNERTIAITISCSVFFSTFYNLWQVQLMSVKNLHFIDLILS